MISEPPQADPQGKAHDGHSAVIRYFVRQSRRNLGRDIGRGPVPRLHEYLHAYAVYGNDGTLITADYRFERIRRRD
jgi:hypothetical protein